MTEEIMTKKQRATLATYPIAVFVFFAFLICMSVFVHNYAQRPDVYASEVIEIEQQEQKELKLQQMLARNNEQSFEPVYQPIKKEGAVPLTAENAHAAIVFDADSGTILWEKNSTDKRSIASITKLVTAMIVVDRMQDIDEVAIVPADVLSIEGTTVGCPTSTICLGEKLRAGEKVRLRDLMRASLIDSANDAATILGIHIAGSEAEFAKLMNARMKEIGAGNTHFCRPSGLELDGAEESCYSSAYDVAQVMAHLAKHEKYNVIWDILQTEEAVFSDVENTVQHELKNTNRLVGAMPTLLGAKTGFTPRAGYCLALAAEDQTKKHTVISVVLDDYHRFSDVEEMNQWAFDSYTWQ